LSGKNEQNKNKTLRIGLFFSDTGGGHRSATEAIQTALAQRLKGNPPEYPVEVLVEAIVENSHPINRKFVQIYNYLLRHQQAAMKYYYWFIETFKPNDSKFGWSISGPYMTRRIVDMGCDVCVSVHPMCNQYIARVLKETGLSTSTKMVTVVTDPNGDFWSGWACPESDLTIVPNDLAQKRLVELGVEPSKIAIMGMPVNPAFISTPSCAPDEFLESLGLSKDLPTICINSGWAGGGNMLAIYRALKAVKRKVQVIFLCGHNMKLYEVIKQEVKNSPIPLAVLPFHDRMADVMAACDLMVTKAGGLTSFEAVASRLPMAFDVITQPMPQEYGTARMLVEQGLATAIEKPRDIVPVAEAIEIRRNQPLKTLPTKHQLDKIDAVYKIADCIIEMAMGNADAVRARLASDSTGVKPGHSKN
jgi:processive 1,2-diacylglycerol beta-glucosyltransferase